MISKIQLRDNQKAIVEEALAERECVIWADTGIGKTIISIEIIARLGLTATIIVKNTVLLEQFRSEIVKYLNIKPKDVGIVGAGKKDIRPITVTTIQSLSADENVLRLLAGSTSLLIVDECQEMVTPKRLKILERFRPSRMYGLSATVQREDARSVEFIFGGCTKFAESKKMSPTVEVTRFSGKMPVLDYPDMIEIMVENKDRNDTIIKLASFEVIAGRKILVLTKRIAHSKTLYDMFPDEWKDGVVHLIDSADKNRNNLIGEFKRGERDFAVIIGTTNLLAVGTDIPQLDTVVLACDMRSAVLTHQSIGRVLRLFEGKPNPKIVELWDTGNPILSNQFKERLRFYRSKKWDIKGV